MLTLEITKCCTLRLMLGVKISTLEKFMVLSDGKTLLKSVWANEKALLHCDMTVDNNLWTRSWSLYLNLLIILESGAFQIFSFPVLSERSSLFTAIIGAYLVFILLLLVNFRVASLKLLSSLLSSTGQVSVTVT